MSEWDENKHIGGPANPYRATQFQDRDGRSRTSPTNFSTTRNHARLRDFNAEQAELRKKYEALLKSQTPITYSGDAVKAANNYIAMGRAFEKPLVEALQEQARLSPETASTPNIYAQRFAKAMKGIEELAKGNTSISDTDIWELSALPGLLAAIGHRDPNPETQKAMEGVKADLIKSRLMGHCRDVFAQSTASR